MHEGANCLPKSKLLFVRTLGKTQTGYSSETVFPNIYLLNEHGCQQLNFENQWVLKGGWKSQFLGRRSWTNENKVPSSKLSSKIDVDWFKKTRWNQNTVFPSNSIFRILFLNEHGCPKVKLGRHFICLVAESRHFWKTESINKKKICVPWQQLWA